LRLRGPWQGLVAACAALATACGGQSTQTAQAHYEELLSTPAKGKTVLVCMPDTPQTEEVLHSLSDEVRSEYHLVAVKVNSKNDANVINMAVERHHPIGLVLMNNPTVAAFRTFRAEHPEAQRLPAVVVMSSFLDAGELLSMGATGISYEVPLITVVTNLRKLMETPVERIGVVYRAPLEPFVQREVRLAGREKIQVILNPVSAQPNVSEIKSAIRDMKGKADALWILNDDRLLTPALIADGWLPGLNERPWRPAIVGAASLVSDTQSFGTLAVLPDHTALGVQTADLLFSLADNEWRLPDSDAQLPLSTTTTFDLKHASERFQIRSGALAQVDRIIQ
jgi:hypothetical protein